MAFRSKQQPKRRRHGERLTSILADPQSFNAPAEEIAAVKEHIGRNLGPDPFDWPVVDHFLGKIYQTSLNPLYPNDPRYEVKRVQPKWSLAAKDLLTTEEDKREVKWNRIVIATNLDEPVGSHDLPEDMTVHVFGIVVDKYSPVTHYYFRRANNPFLVKVTKTGGSDGTATTPCSYTYSVFAGDGTTSFGTGVAVIGPRPNGLTAIPSALSDGLAIYKSRVIKLWSVMEKPTDESCT